MSVRSRNNGVEAEVVRREGGGGSARGQSHMVQLDPRVERGTQSGESRHRNIQVDHHFPRRLSRVNAVEDYRLRDICTYLVQRASLAVCMAAIEHVGIVNPRATRCQGIFETCSNSQQIRSIRHSASEILPCMDYPSTPWNCNLLLAQLLSSVPYWDPWWKMCSKALVWFTITKCAPRRCRLSSLTRCSSSKL